MPPAPSLPMIVAVPIWQARVSPVFDTASRLLVVRRKGAQPLQRREFVLGVMAADALARCVVELNVQVLLCAAISEPLQIALERRGVRVETHLCGEIEAVLAAFFAGTHRRDEFRMPGCWDQHGRGMPGRHSCGMARSAKKEIRNHG